MPGAKPKAIRRREPSLESQAAADDPPLLLSLCHFDQVGANATEPPRNLLIRRSFLGHQAEWTQTAPAQSRRGRHAGLFNYRPSFIMPPAPKRTSHVVIQQGKGNQRMLARELNRAHPTVSPIYGVEADASSAHGAKRRLHPENKSRLLKRIAENLVTNGQIFHLEGRGVVRTVRNFHH